MTASGDSGDDAVRPDAPTPDGPRPDGPHPDAPRPDAPRPDAPRPDAPRAGGVAASASATTGLVEALEILRGRLAATRLPLDLPGAALAREDLGLAVHQLDDYLLPRLRSHAAPLLVVVGGSTGAGKSTLVNSLLGEHVSAPGVLRPTTRAPVLVHHPLDERWFSTDRVLPGLARVSEHGTRSAAPGTATGTPTGPGTGTRPGEPATPPDPTRTLRLVASDALPQGLALVDAPDVDSVETANRELAAQLLAAADLWLFVTTAARYADAVPWDLLHRAAERRAQVAMVLDRVDPGTEAVADDLRRMMDENGLDAATLFVVGESELVDGFLPERAVAAVASWLSALGADGDERDRVATATRDGVVDDLVRRAVLVAGAADAQAASDARLRGVVERAYDEAATTVDAATSDGALLRGEVLARWQDFVGTSELFRSVEQGVGRVRDALAAFFRGRPAQAPQVEQAIAHGLEAVVLDATDVAAERAYGGWRADPAGSALLDGLDLARSSAGVRARVAEEIRGWQSDVLDLVREQGAGKRGAARALSFGINGLGLSLMVVVFASTGGLTGAEVGIAGGTAILAQKLLEAVFGDDAVRRLTRTARERLAERVRVVLDDEALRYTAQLDALGTADADETARSVLEAARAVEAAARVERSARPAVAAGVDGRTAVGRHAARLLRGAGWTPPPPDEPVAAPGDEAAEPARRPGFWRRLLGGEQA
ncbi:GTPase domain-containing protein [Cellulosimicrobium sp. XJ-DQ-B-000]|uniref:GTPase domain-containing protein n=1 Tax=Cellulosimicrobium sp. XJ-DQ-B-000 TaxID=3072182 RepID=UPI002808BD18|nr:GTPase domain-containing protein [Cellulosimicrobium sp. XJ-DQ-B-000]MDQ8040474.1 GTPase domain-containing protein [Cellulosimicrobium sp. XJ-DQ-B-000]